jgi:hypothetical protein
VIGEIVVEAFIVYFGYVLDGWNIKISMESVIRNKKMSFKYLAEAF